MRKPLVLLAIAIVSLSACSTVSTMMGFESLSKRYPCSYTATPVAGETFGEVVLNTMPPRLNKFSPYDLDNWGHLVRERSRFVGADETKLEPTASLQIPRACAKGEKPVG